MELQSLGTFRLVRPLATRSTSFRLYLARHEDDPEHGAPSYVVKLLLPSRSPDHAHLAAQFDHEIKLLQAFNHPGIPSVHGDGEKDGVRYLVMDYVDGCDLAALLGHDDGTPRAISRELAVFIMGQLADALHHIHTFEILDDASNKFVELGVVHRDVCPSNVLLSRQGSVLLADYNSASSTWLPRPHDMSQAGTKAYMAPERIVGTAPASVQSDLFGMAVMLWEMLKGQRCFKADDDLKTMDAIVKFDISHSSRRLTGLSAKLSDIVRKNLDRDPARRYSAAYQMLQRLAQTPEAAAAERAQAELAALVREVSHGRNPGANPAPPPTAAATPIPPAAATATPATRGR
ncbi:serine/threonine-protein kinase [Nannocystis sp.]|uniref:serine/threonine protein kinase n=1 Tax=Nannocystis sp. TaxID=1962667 RepID=UPI0025E78738|nr:serine/threonine-protein kinase [Nannocystis sp.]MBK7830210.1 serine/threonine protein kinase [Nannocystis sp.]